MALFDLPLAELEQYQPPVTEPADFDAYWQHNLRETRQHDLAPLFEPVDVGLRTVESFDVTFTGYGGQPVKGWLIMPRQRVEPLPCVVEYIGYGGGRGFPIDWLLWSSAGYANLVMDTRGQGSAGRHGDTPDIPDIGSSPHYPGFMTLGVLSPDTYYYRRVFLDAVRAVEAARCHPAIDGDRIAVAGRSQGGGITLAVAGLVPDVALAMPEVPFLCHFERATELVDTMPYREIVKFLVGHRDKVETVFHTLSYFDGMNFAARARADALFSVGLMDTTCPPSTVYAAYNRYAGSKEMRVYRFNEHEGGGSHHTLQQMRFVQQHWGI